MLKMRPFQIILLAVFALLAVVGLYLFATTSGLTGSSNTVGTVVIWGTLPQTAMDDAIHTLANSDKSYANVSYVQKQSATFDTDLANALASGTGPDLVVIDQEQLIEEEPRITLIPFSSIPLATFTKDYLTEDELYLTDSGTYGIPLVLDPLVMYYNRSLLSSVGVATAPATWEAVTGLVPSVTQVAGQTVTRSAVALGSYGNVTDARAILSLLFLQAGSPITETSQGGKLQSVLGAGEVVSSTGDTGATAAANFYTQFADPSRTVYSWSPSLSASHQQFLSGDLALYFGFASEAEGLTAGNPNLDFDMAAIPQPATASTRTTYGLAYAFAIPKIATNKSGAYDAALALSGSSILPDLAKELGMVPATRALVAPDPSDPYQAIYYPEALNAKGWLSPAPATVDDIFSAMISNITTGRYATPQALTVADQSINAAL